MACKNTCRLCDRLVISEAVTFTAGTGLVIRIPSGSYNDKEKYCIVVGQTIPNTTVINAPVFIQIGTGSVLTEKSIMLKGLALTQYVIWKIVDFRWRICRKNRCLWFVHTYLFA